MCFIFPSIIVCNSTYVVVQSLSRVQFFVDPMDCSTPGFPVLHYLPEFAQIHVHQGGHANDHLILCCPFSYLQSFPTSGSFPKSQVFTSGDQSIGVLASASVLPMNIWG